MNMPMNDPILDTIDAVRAARLDLLSDPERVAELRENIARVNDAGTRRILTDMLDADLAVLRLRVELQRRPPQPRPDGLELDGPSESSSEAAAWRDRP